MTQEQKERLTSWYLNILVTYRIDFFRGSVFSDIVEIIVLGDKVETYIDRAKKICSGADRLGFAPDQKDYTELLRELREIVNEVPLSDTAQTAITHIFGGDWEEASKSIMKLKSERN